MSAPSKKGVLAALDVLRAYIEAEDTPAMSATAKPTTFDFRDGDGFVPAHRHINPDGSLGGWVADTAHVEPGAFIHETATVTANSHIGFGVRVGPHTSVKGERLTMTDLLLLEFRS